MILGGWLLLAGFAGCGRPQPAVVREEWPEMGTIAAVQFRGSRDPAAQAAVREEFAGVMRLLNAHDPASELARLAKLDDAAVLAACDARMRPCYEAAFRLRDLTGGVFNPRHRGPGTMDLGAIAKGFAVDLAYARLAAPGREALVDLGGNLRACGAWRVGIFGSDETLVLRDGEACATSGAYYRGEHIRDGRDGSTVANAPFSVTVVHPDSAMLADGLSTVMFLLGRERGEEFLKRHFPEARALWVEKGGP